MLLTMDAKHDKIIVGKGKLNILKKSTIGAF